MNKKQSIVAYNNMLDLAEHLDVEDLARVVLDDDIFRRWSGCDNPKLHHYGEYGLITHTWEVVKACQKMRDVFYKYDIDQTELFLAGLYHDVGKIYDYECKDGVYTARKHKRRIHHISRSALIWNDAITKEIDNTLGKYIPGRMQMKENVLHAILSHHGQRAWGSPVAPDTRIAWLLHLCDSMSARLYDCDTNDRID